MKESFVAFFLLALIIGAGIYVRVDAAAEPMWLDECHTAWVVDAESLSEVSARAADGNQPPLYFLLVRLVTKVLGISEFSLRLVSLIAGSGLLIVAPLFANKLTNRWSAAVLAAGLVAFDGQFIYYSAEARSYALVQLLGLIQAMLFWRLLKGSAESKKATSNAATILAWFLLSVLLLYCHYTSIWIIVAETLVMAWLCVRERRIPTGFIVGLLAIAASLIPRLWNVSMVYGRRSNWESVSSIELLWNDVEPWLVHWLLIPAALGFAAWLYQTATETEQSRTNTNDTFLWRTGIWLIAWATAGPIGIAAFDWLGIAPVTLLRYSIVCWVAMALFAAWCLKLYPRYISWVVAFVILASSFFGNWWANELVGRRQLPTFRNQDWVTAVSQIADADTQTPIFQMADVIEDIDAFTNREARFQEYLKFPILGAKAVAKSKLDAESLFVIPTWNIQFTKDHLDAVHKAKGCWLVVRGELDYAVHIPGDLERLLNDSIEFKFIENERMPTSEVHLIQVRITE